MSGHDLDISQLKRLQLELLQKQLQYVYENSKFYRSKFEKSNFKPSDIETVEDIVKVPFTSREELEKNFRELLAVPYSEVATVTF